MSGVSGPRIAIVGLHLEANGFAPVTTRADFEAECWTVGNRISLEARGVSHLPLEIPGFYDQMDATGPWIPVPLILAAAQPGGPIVQSVFDAFLAEAQTRLAAALPVDGIYVCSHGGSCATEDPDNDGTLVARLRGIVGADVPIVVTHDLHCSLSERMIAACDALIAYRTNPHVDHRERAAEAADLLRRMVDGLRTAQAFIRLPLSPPGVTMLLDGPYGDLIRMGEQLCTLPILNISVTSGFVLTDVWKAGFTINVTAEAGAASRAWEVARDLAEAGWADRRRYVRPLADIDAAVNFAVAAGDERRRPVLLAEASDNPGGGARGNSTTLLAALHRSNARNVVLGLLTDPSLAEEAVSSGQGAEIAAIFNRKPGPFADRFETNAKVLAVSDGRAVGRRGRDAGREITLGPSALLRLNGSGLRVVVVSLREQLCDPIMLEMFGVDIAEARTVVLKSRGHFRAGFDIFFDDADIVEVDLPGMTSQDVTRFDFKGLRRPSYPLDPRTSWSVSMDEPDFAAGHLIKAETFP